MNMAKMCEILVTKNYAKTPGRKSDAFYTLNLLLRPTINMPMCYSLVMTTWYPLYSFTLNFIPGEGRCWVFPRNWVSYRDHLPVDIFGGLHSWTCPTTHLPIISTQESCIPLKWDWKSFFISLKLSITFGRSPEVPLLCPVISWANRDKVLICFNLVWKSALSW